MTINRNSNNVTQSNPWQSPVPYLFGGVSAMVALIAVAFLILACSYWNFSGHIDESNESSAPDQDGGKNDKGLVDVEDKVMVIMAGDEKPTYLGKPISATYAAADVGDMNV